MAIVGSAPSSTFVKGHNDLLEALMAVGNRTIMVKL